MTSEPTVKRSTFLKAAAIGAGALLAAPTTARAAVQALTTNKVKDLTGPGLTDRFRMQATDLGIPARTPDGRMLFMFGDTFENPTVGGGWWRSPVALWSTTTDLASGVTWSGAVGGDAAQQLWDYPHDNPTFSTVLPSDVITIGGSMYLHAMVNKVSGTSSGLRSGAPTTPVPAGITPARSSRATSMAGCSSC
jgi:hypothetical protein